MKQRKCLLRYPGAKSKMLGLLQPYIDGMLKGEDVYAEPFIGGGSVALYVARTFPQVKLFINDKDELIAGLWRVICGSQSGVEALIAKLNIVPTVKMWHDIRASDPKTDVDRAFKVIFLNRTSWNGIIYKARPIGGLNQTSIYGVGCRYTVSSLVKLVQEYHDLLAGRTTVTCMDAADFIQEVEAPFYADPPYLFEGNNQLYTVTMAEDEHRALANLLRKEPKWLLTYDMRNKISDEFYHWRGLLHLRSVRYSMDTAHIGKWKHASEIIAWKGFTVKEAA